MTSTETPITDPAPDEIDALVGQRDPLSALRIELGHQPRRVAALDPDRRSPCRTTPSGAK